MAQPSPSLMSATAILFPREAPRAWQTKHAEAEALVTSRALPGFDKRAALAFLHRILMPRSLRWSYLVVGKTGSSSVLMALHGLEFGQPLSTRTDSASLNSDAIGHHLTHAGLLRQLIEIGPPDPLLNKTLRLTSTRHPAERMISAWIYVCSANRQAHADFLQERLLMTILTGLDWDRHAGTPEGFARFLDFLLMAEDPVQGIILDLHLLPMHQVIRPELYRPHLVVRVEEMAAALTRLAEQLGRPAPQAAPRANCQPDYDAASYLQSPGIAAHLERLCAEDCRMFGYHPDPMAPLLDLPDLLSEAKVALSDKGTGA